MIFEQNKEVEKFGEKVGFIFSYLLFTTILYGVLSFLNKIPSGWSVLPVAAITIGIVLVGGILMKVLG
ncbi:hypothetical protein CMO92_02795 [Candidatus Woesearchaeota archaeon]|nr:hypothetical protein [Candidatus Woesearchaeota archaeon]|tara:strand:+ start:501 stop:704 length:204 start_codon:yes stop_codon:yes gene_type:complete